MGKERRSTGSSRRGGWALYRSAPCAHGKKERRYCDKCREEERKKKEYLNREGVRIADSCGGSIWGRSSSC